MEIKKIFFQKAIGGIVFGIFAFLVIFLGIYLTKARTGTTAVPGDKLTASKWNELVSQLSGVQNNVSILSGKFSSETRTDVSAFQNSWGNRTTTYGGSRANAGFYKDNFGVVHLRGLVRGGAIGTTLFTLPAGYRPNKYILSSTISNNGSSHQTARIDVYPSGDVYLQDGGTIRVSLDNISFRTN